MNDFTRYGAHCPRCGHELSAAFAPSDETARPSEGDFSVCGRCAALLVYNPDLTLHLATAPEIDALDGDVLELLQIQRAVRSLPQDTDPKPGG